MDSTRYEQDTTRGNGRMVIGRAFTEVDDLYTSMDVDQVVLFNRVLNAEEREWLLTNNI